MHEKTPEPECYPAREVVIRPISELAPYSKNSRTHTEKQIEQVARSIREFGFTNPVLTDAKGTIVAGHARVEAARSLGLETVPTIPLADLSPDQIRAYIIADNRLAELAGWDDDILAAEFQDLRDAGYNLDLTGFSDSEVNEILAGANAGEGLTDPDETPPLETDAVTKPGDVWILGQHRVACGDSTDPETARAALGKIAPNLMVTDPPYGVEYDAKWRIESGLQQAAAQGVVENDDRADWAEAYRLFPGAIAYIWHAGTKSHEVAASIVNAGYEIRAQIVWVKSRIVISRGHYHRQHEPAFEAEKSPEEPPNELVTHETAAYSVRKGKTGHWRGGRKQSSVWFIDIIRNDTGHSTQKPVECMERPIRNNSSPGQAVYDPFLGSGTTIIAAEKSGRACCGIELNPLYVDLVVRRWQNFTGKIATLEESAQSFAEVERSRIEKDAGSGAGRETEELGWTDE